MPVFLLIRHGDNDCVKKGLLAGRLSGVHLNANGRSQAHAAAERLAGAAVKAIYSSPLERALETAEPIAKVLGLEVVQRPGLVETDFGDWQGQKVKGLAREKLWKMVQNTPGRALFPNGEAIAAAQFRICQELEALARQHDAKDWVVCVSHADPIKLAVAYFIGLPLDMFQRLHISPASMTALHLGEGPGKLLWLNHEISLSLPKS